jgi:antitoxin component YwqK of YwqJK toxin-antitoxin module
MKNIVVLAFMMISTVVFSQEQPKLENIDDHVKATYFYENGNIRQVGTFVDGKLDGKWVSYSEEGNIQMVAQYLNGKRNGKWQLFETPFVTKEVDYKNDSIVQIVTINKNPVAYSN